MGGCASSSAELHPCSSQQEQPRKKGFWSSSFKRLLGEDSGKNTSFKQILLEVTSSLPNNWASQTSAGTPASPSSSLRGWRTAVSSSGALASSLLGGMVDYESGKLSRRGYRTMSSVRNCCLTDGEGPTDFGTAFLHDEEEGTDIQLIEEIGKGGYGRVFLGHQAGRKVAVKAVIGERHAEPSRGTQAEEGLVLTERRESMVQLEALLMSLLTGHPNIVRTHKCLACFQDGFQGQAQGRDLVQYKWFIVMEYCEQGSLWDSLSRGFLHKATELRFGQNDTPLIQWDAWACLETLKEVAR